MKIALITGSCGLVGSESAIFFSKKVLKLSELITTKSFRKDGDITWIKKKLKSNLKIILTLIPTSEILKN